MNSFVYYFGLDPSTNKPFEQDMLRLWLEGDLIKTNTYNNWDNASSKWDVRYITLRRSRKFMARGAYHGPYSCFFFTNGHLCGVSKMSRVFSTRERPDTLNLTMLPFLK